MSNFTKITTLPKYNTLLLELDDMLKSGEIEWHSNQICINTTSESPRDYRLGVGSLMYDWKASSIYDSEFSHKVDVPIKNKILKESDFSVTCSQFIGTSFENVLDTLKLHYSIGRVRLMRSMPNTCLSWHKDSSMRLHYPIKTQSGCFMVIEDEVIHMNKGEWVLSDTTKNHTAFNSSKDIRIHLVAAIL